MAHSASTGGDGESEPLLHFSLDADTETTNSITNSALDGAAVRASSSGELFDNVPKSKRQLGVFSAVFIIFNHVIGTGIYASPSVILRSSGSVGVALIMWVLGALVAAAGTAVYIELGTGLPRSGGEKNYLEFVYRKPQFLITCMFAFYGIIKGSAAANSIVFGEYVMNSLSIPPNPFNTRVIAVSCLTFVCLIHGVFLKWGVRLQNTLGVFKLFVLLSIAVSGIFTLMGVPGLKLQYGYQVPQNFKWENFWEGSGTGANAFVTGFYNIMWSFTGFQGANYALSEVRDPVRTIKRAAPLAMFSVSVVYLLVNISFFIVISKTDILESRRITAALFFRNLFGPRSEKTLSMLIALSTLGNILAGQFSQGRVVQELGREGILPYSQFFASNKPFNAPLAALFTQYIINVTLTIGPPSGDAYLFMINTSSYAYALINLLVSGGLLLLYTPAFQVYEWDPPVRVPKVVIVLFFLSNVLLVIIPLLPPTYGSKVYEHLPYWLHPSVAAGVAVVGLCYWYISCIWFPRRRGCRLERHWVLQDDGVLRCVVREVQIQE